MGRKLTDDKIEELLESVGSASSDRLNSLLADNAEDLRDFEISRSVDALLKSAWKDKPVRLPSRLENFSLKSRKTSKLFSLPKIAPIAAAILVVLIAALWLMLSTAPPTGDKLRVDELLASATDTSLAPGELRIAQKELLTYLAQFYGSYIELRNASKLPDFDSDYRTACAVYEKKGLSSISSETDHVTRLSIIEKTAESCGGLISPDTAEMYRQSVKALVERIENSLSNWRNDGSVDETWMTGRFEPAQALLNSSTTAISKDVYFAWRALLDGVPRSEISARFSALPTNLKLPMAVLATRVVACKLRYHKELVDNPNILSLAAESLESDFSENPEATARIAGIFSALPLWATFFEQRKAIPKRLRRLFDNVENMFVAVEGELSRNRIDPTLIADAFRSALGANDRFFLNSSSNASAWRNANLYNEVAILDSNGGEDLADFVMRANLMRMLLGREMISIVFENGNDFETVESPVIGLRSSSPNIDAFRKVFFGTSNRLMPVFRGAGDSSYIQMYIYNGKNSPVLPQNYISISLKKASPVQPSSGDSPGKF